MHWNILQEMKNKMQIDKNIMDQKYSYSAVTVCKLPQRYSGETDQLRPTACHSFTEMITLQEIIWKRKSYKTIKWKQ